MFVDCGRVGFDPVVIDAGASTAELSHRGSAPCVRSPDGRVACWGENEYGQLGRGTISSFEGPALVPIENAVALATGENTAFAIDSDGALWGWGDNGEGQLGLGTRTIAEATPRRVSIPPVTQVVAGQFHTCAVTETGELYCWGGNSCGQLGIGSTETVPTPTLIAGATGVRQVAIADRETCFIDGNGELLCMGSPYLGQSACVNRRLVPTALPGVSSISFVAGGCHVEMCALDAAGQASCWGENRSGVGGDGTTMPRADPSPVMSLANARVIGTGYDASCAVTTSDEVYCWGGNAAGQLGVGDSSITEQLVPRRLPFFSGALAIDQLEVGCSASCVRSGTEVYCWGDNVEQIIDDTANPAFAPLQRTGLPF